MSELVPNMSQREMDLIFSQLTEDDTVREFVSAEEHYQHLITQGYPEDEIEITFGLKVVEGKVYEV